MFFYVQKYNCRFLIVDFQQFFQTGKINTITILYKNQVTLLLFSILFYLFLLYIMNYKKETAVSEFRYCGFLIFSSILVRSFLICSFWTRSISDPFRYISIVSVLIRKEAGYKVSLADLLKLRLLVAAAVCRMRTTLGKTTCLRRLDRRSDLSLQ